MIARNDRVFEWSPPGSVEEGVARLDEAIDIKARIECDLGAVDAIDSTTGRPMSEREYSAWRHRANLKKAHVESDIRKLKRWLHEQRMDLRIRKVNADPDDPEALIERATQVLNKLCRQHGYSDEAQETIDALKAFLSKAGRA